MAWSVGFLLAILSVTEFLSFGGVVLLPFLVRLAPRVSRSKPKACPVLPDGPSFSLKKEAKST